MKTTVSRGVGRAKGGSYQRSQDDKILKLLSIRYTISHKESTPSKSIREDSQKKNSKLNDIVQKGGRGVNSNHNILSFLIVTWGEGVGFL